MPLGALRELFKTYQRQLGWPSESRQSLCTNRIQLYTIRIHEPVTEVVRSVHPSSGSWWLQPSICWIDKLSTSVDNCQQLSKETSEACAWPRMSRSQRSEARATTVRNSTALRMGQVGHCCVQVLSTTTVYSGRGQGSSAPLHHPLLPRDWAVFKQVNFTVNFTTLC